VTTYLGSAPSRRRLASELRRYRFQSSLTVEDVAEALSWSCRKICRIESGRRVASGEDLRRLLAEYHVDDPETAASLIAMAGDSEQQRQMAGPVYRRIAEDLRRKIESGELDHGIQLPTELEVSREYDVSRAPDPVGGENLVIDLDPAFYAARWHSLMRP
jgi:transcriptional regulator with XRE-family HTH domain